MQGDARSGRNAKWLKCQEAASVLAEKRLKTAILTAVNSHLAAVNSHLRIRGCPAHRVDYPEHEISYPAHQIAIPEHRVAIPAREIGHPAFRIVTPASRVAYPAREIACPVHEIAIPVHGIAFPARRVATPTRRVATPVLGAAYRRDGPLEFVRLWPYLPAMSSDPSRSSGDPRRDLHGTLFQAHPWHGVPARTRKGEALNAFIEIVPTDTVKYELDKASGHLRIDRPQLYSSVCPTLYGFIPQTYCGSSTAERCQARTGLTGLQGDGDPLDICVLTEKAISHGNLLVSARPIGGLRMIDGVQADDKIIAVLEADINYGHMRDVADCPPGVLDRLKHYFLSYKQGPSSRPRSPSRRSTIGPRHSR